MGGRYVFFATPMQGGKCQSGRGSRIRSSVQDQRRTSLQVVGVQDVKKRQAIVAKVMSRYWRTPHRFGVELPHCVEEAYKLDEKNNNNYWRAAIEKEMSRVRVVFEKWTGGNTCEEAKRKLVG